MPKPQNAKEAAYVQSLLKEALYLTTELAKIDKKIETDLNVQSTSLTKWIDENSLVNWGIEYGTDTASEKALEAIFGNIFKLLKLTTGPAGLLADITVQVFSSSGRPSKRDAYLDTRPQLASDYDTKKRRLERIRAELFWYQPPIAGRMAPPDRCVQEACWRAAK